MLYADLEVSRLLVRERHEQLKRDAARRSHRRAARLGGTFLIATFEGLRTAYVRRVHRRLPARA